MWPFLEYELKVAAALVVFSLFYKLLLSKETFHRFNRVVLLLTSALAFILPFCIIVFHETVNAAGPAGVQLQSEAMNMTPPGPAIDWNSAAAAIIFIGALAVLARTGLSILKIRQLLTEGRQVPQNDGTRLVVVKDKKYSPFSWMKYIVMSEEDYSSTGEGILIHEKAHIALGHSWDILFFDLMTALQWFNPAVWILKGDLRALHEYEADEAVIEAGTDIREYQLLLVRKAVATVRYPAANNLNHSILKNRITMMLCKRSSVLETLKALYVIPFVCLSLVLNAETRYDYAADPIADAVEQALMETAQPLQQRDEPVPFQNVDVKPSFNGGDATKFSMWVNSQLVYPQEAKDKNIQGRVTVSFVVERDGSVTNVKIVRGVDPMLDAETIRVVSASPKWTPGSLKGENVRVSYIFPVVFLLNDNGSNARPQQSKTGFKVSGTVTDEDGKPMPAVLVTVKGSQKHGSVTAVNGKYQIEVPSKDCVIVFSMIDYQNMEVAVDGNPTIDLKMKKK